MRFRDAVLQIIVGTSIVVFSGILIGAGSIVWSASMNYKHDMKAYFEASTEVFSTEIANLSSDQRSLRSDLARQSELLLNIENSLNELWNLANSEIDYYSEEVLSGESLSSDPEIQKLEKLVDEETKEISISEMSMGASPTEPVRSERTVKKVEKQQKIQQTVPTTQNYEVYKKADIMNRIQQAQQQIQQTRN
jgi:hypothetical protein